MHEVHECRSVIEYITSIFEARIVDRTQFAHHSFNIFLILLYKIWLDSVLNARDFHVSSPLLIDFIYTTIRKFGRVRFTRRQLRHHESHNGHNGSHEYWIPEHFAMLLA